MNLFDINSSGNKKPYVFYWGILLTLVLATAILLHAPDSPFTRFLGELDPMIVLIVSGTIGFFILEFFLPRFQLFILRKATRRSISPYLLLGSTLAFVAIAVDLVIVYPRNIHVPWPESFLFYPVMGLVAEVVFHVIPLFVLLAFSSFFLSKTGIRKYIWILIFLVALIEPTYQVVFMETYATWAIIVVWLNLFLFNTIQLIVFFRFDFLWMYAFRLCYYVIWHLLWGYFRLDILF